MNITLNSTLRSLRRKKNVTQEELASHLGITAQSVGKWERGEGFPDITLLPAIALYFGVTTDELLGIDKARIDERIKSLEAESLRLRNLGDVPENLALWESAYREFPNDCRVMSHLMDALGQDPHYPRPGMSVSAVSGSASASWTSRPTQSSANTPLCRSAIPLMNCVTRKTR